MKVSPNRCLRIFRQPLQKQRRLENLTELKVIRVIKETKAIKVIKEIQVPRVLREYVGKQVLRVLKEFRV